jgi:putative acetyltransferase
VLIRRETPTDVDAIRAVHAAAFAKTTDDGTPVEATPVEATPAEATLVDALRADEGWLPAYSLVAVDSDGLVVGHVVLGAADARDEPLVVLLGHPGYYPRFGFRPAVELGVTPPQPWGPQYFMARPLTAWRASIRGEFRYARPFDDL